MNQVRRSAVESMKPESKEYAIAQSICKHTRNSNQTKNETENWPEVREVLDKVNEFILR